MRVLSCLARRWATGMADRFRVPVSDRMERADAAVAPWHRHPGSRRDLLRCCGDVSWEAEDTVIGSRVTGTCAPARCKFVIRRACIFGMNSVSGPGFSPCRCRSADESLACGILTPWAPSRPASKQTDRLDIYAPFGLDDLFAMIMRPGPLAAQRTVFEAKAARARAVWPEVTVIDWTEP